MGYLNFSGILTREVLGFSGCDLVGIFVGVTVMKGFGYSRWNFIGNG